MVSMSDELKERNMLELILIVRFACATFEVGRPMDATYSAITGQSQIVRIVIVQ
jgi:hypothetical protein